jgi:ESCRT-I complex subunit VPS37
VRVHLPNSGDRVRAPAMTMAGVRARHPWLDAKMRVIGYPAILSDDKWKASNMLLGTAVHEVVKHLQLEPPEVLEITDAGLQSIQSGRRNGSNKASTTTTASTTTINSVGRSSRSKSSDRNDDAPPEYSSVLLNMPEVPRQILELDALSREDLDQLAEDELEFAAFINKLPIFQQIQSTANDVLDENAKKAKANLEKEDRIKALFKEVTELKSTLETKLDNFQSLERKQDALCAPPDKKDILRQLATGKKEAFLESEQLAESWVEDGANVDAFVASFIEKRRIHHIRAAKMERLQSPNT